ncbi:MULTISPECIES: TlpA disulfide reductase family protein [unclassified Sphingobacterium]|uniref:TlpA disulfide reductase family protein n=1 Tax=unclassified Sphingobacterium TaxID=2609468 RepID=UPI0025DC3BB3|nr:MULTISPECIES: TlpA disulfide reductase family protein [unclassified Sphingobacterium]
MKNKIIYALATVLLLWNNVGFAQKKYAVKGNIQGWTEDYIVLVRRGNYPGTDSVKNVNGSFEFNGTIDGFTSAFIVARTTEPKYKFFFLEPGTTEINGTFSNLAEADVKGSRATDEYQIVRQAHKIFESKKDSVFTLHRGEADSLRMQTYNQQIKDFDAEEMDFAKQFIQNHPGSPASLIELGKINLKLDYKEIRQLWDGLDKELKSVTEAKELGDLINNLKNVQIGELAPVFSQNDTLGRPISLIDFRGKYVLVDFWASWCVPCRRENPNLLKAYQTYKDKGLEILGVSLDYSNGEKFWERAIKNDGIIWPQVSDLKGYDNEVAVRYAIQFVPSNFLLDPQGRIIAKNLTGSNLNDKLKEIFEKQSKEHI